MGQDLKERVEPLDSWSRAAWRGDPSRRGRPARAELTTHDGLGEGPVLQAWGSASAWDCDIPEHPGESSMEGHQRPPEPVSTEGAASLTRHSYTQPPKQPQTRDPRVLTQESILPLGKWHSGHTLPTHQQGDARGQMQPEPWGLRPRQAEVTGAGVHRLLWESLLSPLRAQQKGANPHLLISIYRS